MIVAERIVEWATMIQDTLRLLILQEIAAGVPDPSFLEDLQTSLQDATRDNL